MMYRWISGLILAGAVAAIAPAAQAQQSSLGIAAEESASGFGRQVGRKLVFICPAITAPSENVWGEDVYSVDSAICTAAIHARVLQFGQAGRVDIVMGPSVQPLIGSDRNGVKTQGYPNHYDTFTFSQSPDTPTIDWNTTATRIPAEYDEPITVLCPGDQKSDGSVWGTDTYTSDSSICNAAVHAGVIAPPPQGGALTVTRVPGIDAYVAEARNGISSGA